MSAEEKTDYAEIYRKNLLGNYPEAPLTITRGEGSYVWDDERRHYLDFTSGIAVNALGHAHPAWVAAVVEQAATLAHVSNLYRNTQQAKLGERLNALAGGNGKVMFCNSGAEANEALLKLARLHGMATTGEEGKRYTVIVAENAFHGRTFGGMAATPQEKIQGGFRPMLDGFVSAPFNELDCFADRIDDRTAAIFVETVQGESGVYPAQKKFLQGLRNLCDEHGLLLILDEVQCGAGRTGKYFAFEHAGVRPDAIGMAKGLGGGFPIGAIWVDDRYAPLFKPGSHGTTFGGNPLACAAALATLDALDEEQLLARVTRQSIDWHCELNRLAHDYPQLVNDVRAVGYMVGIGLNVPAADVVAELRNNGLLAPPAGNDTLRLLPPLNATESELSTATDILEQVLKAQARQSFEETF